MSGLFFLAAFFESTFLTLVWNAVLILFPPDGFSLLTAGLLVLSRIAPWRFLRTATLLARAAADATLLHSLIAIPIVCHISASPLF